MDANRKATEEGEIHATAPPGAGRSASSRFIATAIQARAKPPSGCACAEPSRAPTRRQIVLTPFGSLNRSTQEGKCRCVLGGSVGQSGGGAPSTPQTPQTPQTPH